TSRHSTLFTWRQHYAADWTTSPSSPTIRPWPPSPNTSVSRPTTRVDELGQAPGSGATTRAGAICAGRPGRRQPRPRSDHLLIPTPPAMKRTPMVVASVTISSGRHSGRGTIRVGRPPHGQGAYTGRQDLPPVEVSGQFITCPPGTCPPLRERRLLELLAFAGVAEPGEVGDEAGRTGRHRGAQGRDDSLRGFLVE